MNTELLNKILFLVDFSWLYNKYYYGVVVNTLKEPEPDVNDEEISRRISSYLDKHLVSIKHVLGDSEITLVLDTPLSKSYNKELFPDYKGQRLPEIKNQVYRFYPDVLKILSKEYNMVKCEGYEADQVIANLAITNRSKYKGVIIYSGDKDLLQLTCYHNIRVANKFKNNKLHVLNDDEIFYKFKDYRGISFSERISNHIADLFKYRVLKGDVSDNIPPVLYRIKEKDIKLIINEFWTENKLSEAYINEILDNLYSVDSDLSDKLRDKKEDWLRNYRLMNLFIMGKKDLKIEVIND